MKKEVIKGVNLSSVIGHKILCRGRKFKKFSFFCKVVTNLYTLHWKPLNTSLNFNRITMEQITRLLKVKNYSGVLVVRIDAEDAKIHEIKENDIVKVTIEKLSDEGPSKEILEGLEFLGEQEQGAVFSHQTQND